MTALVSLDPLGWEPKVGGWSAFGSGPQASLSGLNRCSLDIALQETFAGKSHNEVASLPFL